MASAKARDWTTGIWAAVVGAVALVTVIASPAVAQDRDPDLRKPPATSTDQLMAGPTMFETGRVGAMDVTQPGVTIEKRRDFAAPGEAAIRASAPGEQTATVPRPAAAIDPAALEREVRAHLAALPDCRMEAARRGQIHPDQVIASELLLRWTILPSGAVADTAVVATQPIDDGIMGCVKQRMNSWTFSPLAGTSAALQRTLVFAR